MLRSSMYVAEPPSALLSAHPVEDRTGTRTALWCGGLLTPCLFALSWLSRQVLPLDTLELAVGFSMFHAAFVVNDPHFSVTYLLYYERWSERALGQALPPALRLRYWLCGVVVPLALVAWGALGLAHADVQLLGLMLQLMLALVGWHYVKQGFGAALVLARRRGAAFSLRERRAMWAHAISCWAYAWANPATPAQTVEVRSLVYRAFARPLWFESVALWGVVATGALLLAVLGSGPAWARRRALGMPLGVFFVSLWLFTVLANADPLVRYVIPALHSVQYGYFVALLKGGEARERENEPYFEPPAKTRLVRLGLLAVTLGFALFHGVPWLLDGARLHDRDALGSTPCFAVIYAIVNLHHYAMDSVLWRRDQPTTRYLAPSAS
jgi:hypothetical protein